MFRPNKGKVLVKIEDKKSASGLILPESVGDWQAKVIATWNIHSMNISGEQVEQCYFSEGDTVIMTQNVGVEIELNGDKYRLVPEANIHGALL
jgi:co-chaperonin GroES (HSP10)